MRRSDVDIAAEQVPMAWHELHRTVPTDACVEVVVAGDATVTGEVRPGRTVDQWIDVAVGAGFVVEEHHLDDGEVALRLRALRSLADTVGPDMCLLVCGLNPSLHAADAGVGFVTGNNRFWPAALRAGIVSVDRDPVHALRSHGVGMTDLVKRPTPRASELSTVEYRDGAERLDRLCAWLRPEAVVMVGLAGWRAATDRRATTGWQDRRLGGSPVYVMPSTSGLNARTTLDELVEHLRTASAG